MVKRYGSVDLQPDKDITTWYIIGEVDTEKKVILVSITNNPLIVAPGRYANIVYKKLPSLSTAKQVARGARRYFDITEMAQVKKHGYPSRDVPNGSICKGGIAYPAEVKMPGYDFLIFASSHTIDEIMKRNPHNTPDASKARFVVYEVRGGVAPMRGITNKMHSVQRWWAVTPPEGYLNSEIVQIGQFASYQDALNQCEGHFKVSDALWPKRPSIEYLRRIIKIDEHGVMRWTSNGEPAVKYYNKNGTVVVGPHSYTAPMMKTALERGIWVDRRRNSDVFPP